MVPLSESNTLYKVVVVLGAVFLLVGLLTDWNGSYPGGSTAWDNLSDTLSSGVTIPTFSNPFEGQTVSVATGLASPWDAGVSSGFFKVYSVNGTANNCTLAQYWKCVQDPDGFDGNQTYITLYDDEVNPTGFFALNLTGNFGAGKVVNANVQMSCRINGGDNSALSALVGSPGAPPLYSGLYFVSQATGGAYCQRGNAFTNVTIPLNPQMGDIADLATSSYKPNLIGFFGTVAGSAPPNPTRLDISSISVTVYITGYSSQCGGTDFFGNIGCQVQQFFQPIINFFGIIIGGIIWLGTLIVTIIIFFATVIGGLFIGIFSIILWLLAVPGAPTVIQAIIAIPTLALLAWVFYIIVKTIRGTSTI